LICNTATIITTNTTKIATRMAERVVYGVELKTMISLTRMIILSRKHFNQNLNFEAPCCVASVPAVTIHLCTATFAVKLKAT
jgi:hypothetical protein